MNKRKGSFARGLTLTLLVFAVLIAGGSWLVGRIGRASGSAETEIVRDAVHSAVLTCYAVEGAYPSSIDYLKAHYGLAYNEEAYIVGYDAFASNVMPDVRVLERGSVR